MFGNNLDIVFFILAMVFAAFTFREYRRDKENLSASGRTWRRMAIIFFLMSVYLFYLHRLTPG